MDHLPAGTREIEIEASRASRERFDLPDRRVVLPLQRLPPLSPFRAAGLGL